MTIWASPFNLRELLLRVRGMLRRQGWYGQPNQGHAHW